MLQVEFIGKDFICFVVGFSNFFRVGIELLCRYGVVVQIFCRICDLQGQGLVWVCIGFWKVVSSCWVLLVIMFFGLIVVVLVLCFLLRIGMKCCRIELVIVMVSILKVLLVVFSGWLNGICVFFIMLVCIWLSRMVCWWLLLLMFFSGVF